MGASVFVDDSRWNASVRQKDNEFGSLCDNVGGRDRKETSRTTSPPSNGATSVHSASREAPKDLQTIALRQFEDLAVHRPSALIYVARTLVEAARLCRGTGDYQGAKTQALRAVAICDALVRESPMDIRVAADCANALICLGSCAWIFAMRPPPSDTCSRRSITALRNRSCTWQCCLTTMNWDGRIKPWKARRCTARMGGIPWVVWKSRVDYQRRRRDRRRVVLADILDSLAAMDAEARDVASAATSIALLLTSWIGRRSRGGQEEIVVQLSVVHRHFAEQLLDERRYEDAEAYAQGAIDMLTVVIDHYRAT